MSDHQHPAFVRHCDVAVVGGSAAGLAAALQLARQRRSVIVLDDGTPRNAPAGHVHGYLGLEGVPTAQLLHQARAEVRGYGGEVLAGRVRRVSRTPEGFLVEVDGGTVAARRVLAATGLGDELPEVAGLAEHWGGDVVHCPFCHGFEVRDRRIVQLVTHPTGLHSAAIWRGLTDRLTVVVPPELDPPPGLDVVVGRATRVLADAGRVVAVELADGVRLPADVVAVGPWFRVRAEPFDGLTTAPHPSGLGEVVTTDPAGQTSVPGLYAAGNLTDPSHQVSQAAADGSRVGAMIAFSLAAEATTPPTDWDLRYSGDRVWSGNPNGNLVAEITGLSPGRALDVGAGEGGDAVWLAEQGWSVTASDVSARALDRVAAEADRRGLPVALLHTDAGALDAYPTGGFDLVSMAYGAVPRTPDDRGVANILGAVATGGTLLVLGHDLSEGGPAAFDPAAYVQVADLAAAVAGAPGWQVEVSETRPRPPGAASGHHVDDVVLRARRAG